MTARLCLNIYNETGSKIRRPQEFFAGVYAYLLEKYAKFLAESNNLITVRNKSGNIRAFWERKIAKGLVVSSLAIWGVVPLGLEPRTP